MSDSITNKELLSLLEKELEFYRKGIVQVFTITIATQALILTGQKVITVSPEIIGTVIVSLFFLLVPVISYSFYSRYGNRIKYLRKKRTSLIKESGKEDPSNDPTVYVSSIYHIYHIYHIYLFIISGLSVLGVTVAMFGQ